MNTEIRNPESTVAYLSRSMMHWQPGKIIVSKYELVNDKLIDGFSHKETTEGLARLEFQIDKMMRNSPSK